MALRQLTGAEFKAEVHKRLEAAGVEIKVADLHAVFRAIKEETADCLANGYRFIIPGLVKFDVYYTTPLPKRKGVNPFDREAGEVWLKPRPAGLRAKAFASTALTKALPSLKTKLGKELVELAMPPEKKPAKKAAPKKGAK